MRPLALLLALALAGCAEMTARGSAPIFVGQAGPVEATAVCLVRAFNGAMSSGPITHKIDIIEPQRILEVAPQQVITQDAERYFARVTARSAGASTVELFANGTFVGDTTPAARSCTKGTP